MITLKIDSLTYKYKNFELKDINLKTNKSEVIGLVGANGAGKTTLIKCITGQLVPHKGDITLFNHSITKEPEKFKQIMGYVCENTDIYPMLRAKDFANVIKKFYSDWDDNKFNCLSKTLGLDLNKPIKTYSKGMKVKLHLAISLSHDAKLLIMDEPTSGLDPFVRKKIMNILSSRATDKDSTVLFSTHIIEDVLDFADKIAFLSKGNLVFFEKKDELIRDFYKIGANSLSKSLNKYLYYKNKEIAILKIPPQNNINDIIKKDLKEHHLPFNDLIEIFETNGGRV